MTDKQIPDSLIKKGVRAVTGYAHRATESKTLEGSLLSEGQREKDRVFSIIDLLYITNAISGAHRSHIEGYLATKFYKPSAIITETYGRVEMSSRPQERSVTFNDPKVMEGVSNFIKSSEYQSSDLPKIALKFDYTDNKLTREDQGNSITEPNPGKQQDRDLNREASVLRIISLQLTKGMDARGRTGAVQPNTNIYSARETIQQIIETPEEVLHKQALTGLYNLVDQANSMSYRH
jgi:hypothetical protein